MEILDEDQVRMLLIAAKGKRHEALYKVAITTGLRKGSSLDLNGVIWIGIHSNSMCKGKFKECLKKVLTYSQPKTAAGRRMIVLGSDTITTLKEHRKRQWVEREFKGDKWQDHDLIFPSSIGTPLSQSNLIAEL
jgi:integrase